MTDAQWELFLSVRRQQKASSSSWNVGPLMARPSTSWTTALEPITWASVPLSAHALRLNLRLPHGDHTGWEPCPPEVRCELASASAFETFFLSGAPQSALAAAGRSFR